MVLQKALYESPQGGSIVCFEGLIGRIYRSCSANRCIYSNDLHSAKSGLKNLERRKNLLPGNSNINSIPQRQTTLKWNTDGSLSSIDMARILNSLQKRHLTECEFSCEYNY